MSTKTLPRIKPGTFTIVILTALLFAVLASGSDTFLSYRNIYTILYGVSIEYFAVIGFTILLIMGQVDLSVGSVYGFSGVLVGFLMMGGIPFLPAFLAALIICAAFGTLTGFLVTKFDLNSMMVTIGMMTLIRGLSWVLIRSQAGKTFDRAFRSMARAKIGEFNTTVIIMFILVIALEFFLRKSPFFKKVYYVGENLSTAEIYGIKAKRIKTAMFALSSFTAAIGGALAASRITHADVTTGDSLEFKMLTAAILGGASLYGGKGSILNSVIGLIFLAAIVNGMIIYNIEPLLQQFVIGVILIVSVYVDTKLNKEKS
jgi:ribose transport system permease protein